jgi:putative nucleotidyltransferase with HDIG domain
MSREHIANTVAGVKALPTLPTILSQILATTADPEGSAVELSRHIESDQTLSAMLLRTVNSAYYGLHRQVDSIKQAVVMLGFFEVRNLTLAATAFRSFPRGHPAFDRAQLWRHSLATALASERLAKRAGLGAESAFVEGLLHDIGKVVFDALYPEEFREAACRAHERECLILETEHEIFGMDHTEAGAILGDHWDLPERVVDAIKGHHSPAGQQKESLTRLVALADSVTYGADLGESSNGASPGLAPGEILPNVNGNQCSAVSMELRENRQGIDECLGILGV